MFFVQKTPINNERSGKVLMVKSFNGFLCELRLQFDRKMRQRIILERQQNFKWVSLNLWKFSCSIWDYLTFVCFFFISLLIHIIWLFCFSFCCDFICFNNFILSFIQIHFLHFYCYLKIFHFFPPFDFWNNCAALWSTLKLFFNKGQ